MRSRQHSAGISALILVSAGILVTAACHQPDNRERFRQEARERLMAKIKEEQAIEARLRQVGAGTPSSEVLKQFGNPGSTAPCRNAKKCWYYDISGQKYFVCFDEQDNVACQGRAYLLPQYPRMRPPN